MDEVCSSIMSMLHNTLASEWPTLLNQSLAELISESHVTQPQLKELQKTWWERLQPQVQAWTKRQAGNVWRRKFSPREATPQTIEQRFFTPEITTAANKLKQALRQLILVQTLIDETQSPNGDKAVREQLWLELAPQVSRIAHCYEKSAAKRGLEVDDLIQDASAHFQQVITRFNPEDSRRAMLSTWFDDVVDNLFSATVRPRKSDPLKRGQGGDAEEQLADELPTSPKQSLRYVRDFQRQQKVEDSLRQVDEICSRLVESGACPLERVLAFKLYLCEGLTYQEVAEALKARGYQYGTTQMFNFVKEVKAHVLGRFEGDPFSP